MVIHRHPSAVERRSFDLVRVLLSSQIDSVTCMLP